MVVSTQSLFLQDQHQSQPPHPLVDQDTLSHLSTDVFVRCRADKGEADQEDILQAYNHGAELG